MQGKRIGVVALFMVWVGCGNDDGKPRLAERAEQVRELALLDTVDSETLTQDEFNARVDSDVQERTDEELRRLADTYGRLGFFDIGLDLRPILTNSRIDSTGAFYSSRDKRITLIDEPATSTVVHEYVHALQDQHFDLAAYDRDTSDEFLARRAVVEGDATLASARFQIEEQTGGLGLEAIDFGQYLADYRMFSEEVLDTSPYPILFRGYLSFTYAYGLRYSAQNLLYLTDEQPVALPPPHDWTRQDALFTGRPPATSEEIISGADRVVAIGIDDVPATLVSRLEGVGWDVLGAWYSHLLLRGADLATAARLRDSWDGDRVLFARDRGTAAMGVLWASAWEDEGAAEMAATLLHALHDGDGETLVIERRGTRLVLARNFAADLTPTLVTAAFAGPSLPKHRRERAALRASMRGLLAAEGCWTGK